MSQKYAHTMHNKEAGFMGLEGMGTILFYLIMLAGATILIAQLFSTSKLVKTATAVSAMCVEIKHLYITQNNYGPDDTNITKLVVDAGAAPKGFTFDTDSDGDFITSPWNTPIRVETKLNGKVFSIVVRTPPEYCMRLATHDLDSWYKITVGDYTITDNPNSVHAALEGLEHASKDGLISVRFYSE